jgi:hypothetical protein
MCTIPYNVYTLYPITDLVLLQVRCVLVNCCGVQPPTDESEPAPAQQAAAPAAEAAPAAQVPISEPLIPADKAEERV